MIRLSAKAAETRLVRQGMGWAHDSNGPLATIGRAVLAKAMLYHGHPGAMEPTAITRAGGTPGTPAAPSNSKRDDTVVAAE
jgi:hypothetical protein